jgi:NADH-quinone oxidoreductase subunit L
VAVALVLAIPWLGALGVWTAGDGRPRLRDGMAVGASVAAALSGLVVLVGPTTDAVLRLPAAAPAFGSFVFVPDGLAGALSVVATSIGFLAIVFSLDYMRGQPGLARYYALMLIFIGAMVGLVLSGSLLLLLVFWELVGLCSCALIGFESEHRLAVSGAIRALVVTQFGGLGLLVGILAARTALNTDRISEVIEGAPSLAPPVLAVIGYGFLMAAAAKSAQVPFHIWLPGAMEAPTPVSALIHAATMVNAGVYLLVRFSPALVLVPGWQATVLSLGVISALLGSVMALCSTDLKRALAYSTISQLGLLFYAVGVNAIFASQFHLVSHAIFKALLFLCAGAVIWRTGTRDLGKLGGLRSAMPVVTLTFVIGCLAMIGIPGFSGFVSKELIFDTGESGGPRWAYLVMLVSTALTAAYSARLTWLVFGGPAHWQVRDAGCAMQLALFALAAGSVAAWTVVGPLSGLLAVGSPVEYAGWQPVVKVLTSGASGVGLGATAVGLGSWWFRARLSAVLVHLEWLRQLALYDLGFYVVEASTLRIVRGLSAAVQGLHTGRLNWNLATACCGLLVVLVSLVYAGPRP